jgi:hypothetical protein
VPGVYLTDSLSGSIGGMLGSRLEQSISLTHSAGRRPDQLGEKVTYVTTTGTAQLRFILTQRLSALVSYTHLRFHLDSPPRPYPTGMEMHRHSARVGLTWSQPLVGGGRGGRQPRN